MLWALSGNAMSTPVVLGLFTLTAVSDNENRKMFSFKIASTLAEQILRVLSTLTPDKVNIITVGDGLERTLLPCCNLPVLTTSRGVSMSYFNT